MLAIWSGSKKTGIEDHEARSSSGKEEDSSIWLADGKKKPVKFTRSTCTW
jgi:hypothetical protein